MTKLYTDTSANLPLALLREYDIAVIPFSYTVNGVAEDYNEEMDFDGKAFYDAMRRGAEVKTSMVNPATAAAFFERALAQGDDVLYVGMSGGSRSLMMNCGSPSSAPMWTATVEPSPRTTTPCSSRGMVTQWYLRMPP
jgi:fatty acid-binding protein DegV